MMPIFFHSQAHLWIFYALFVNGFLLNRIFAEYSDNYQQLSQQFEAQVILSFAFSLAFNGLLLLGLDLANRPFSSAIYFLIGSTVILLGIVFWRRLYAAWKVDVNWLALLLYASMFVILFYNGGMIDQISDAWWHMSLANKIGWASSFTLEYGHLTGVPDRYYPPLWHANLALLRELSDQGLPILWNAFTAWGGALKLMAYYLLGTALFQDRKIGLIGAVLFALLPGLGNSYMRVSAWPSHLAYIIWFFAIFLGIRILDIPKRHLSKFEHLVTLARGYVALALLAFCLTLVYFLHQFEVLLFAACFFLYFMGISLFRMWFAKNDDAIASLQLPLYSLVYRLGLVSIAGFAIYFAFQSVKPSSTTDDVLLLGLPVFICMTLLVCDLAAGRFPVFSKVLCGLILLVLLASTNYQHLASLFVPELALPNGASGEKPLIATGLFGGTLGLPGWHLQLRAGLLWSGVAGSLISLVMVIIKPSRAWLMLSANFGFVWVLCVSPYLYQWFTDSLSYHSVWRFAMLSFHPLAIAGFTVYLLRSTILAFNETSKAPVATR